MGSNRLQWNPDKTEWLLILEPTDSRSLLSLVINRIALPQKNSVQHILILPSCLSSKQYIIGSSFIIITLHWSYFSGTKRFWIPLSRWSSLCHVMYLKNCSVDSAFFDQANKEQLQRRVRNSIQSIQILLYRRRFGEPWKKKSSVAKVPHFPFFIHLN